MSSSSSSEWFANWAVAKTGKKAELIARLEEDDAQKARESQHVSQPLPAESTDPIRDSAPEAAVSHTKDEINDETAKALRAPAAEATAIDTAPVESRKLSADTEGAMEMPMARASIELSSKDIIDASIPDGVDLPADQSPQRDVSGISTDAVRAGPESQIDVITSKELKRTAQDLSSLPQTKRSRIDSSVAYEKGRHAAAMKIEEASEQKALASDKDCTDVDDSKELKDDLTKQQNTVDDSNDSATNVLYIENLVRPINEDELRRHLESIAQESVELYLSALKTHAFARFESKDRAVKTREALQGQVWPEEAGRRPLNVDHITGAQMSEFVKAEEAHPRNVRWQVMYEDAERGRTVEHKQVPINKVPLDASRDGQGLVTRGQRKVLKLDELFRKTRSRPSLFYLPRRVYN